MSLRPRKYALSSTQLEVFLMRIFTSIVLCAFCLIGLAWGQAGLGSISGTVVDAADAVVPNAVIIVRQLSTNSERVTVTNESGIFNVPSLVASTYTINITAAGFREKQIENLTLNAFQTMTLGRLQLEVGSGPSTEVKVTARSEERRVGKECR